MPTDAEIERLESNAAFKALYNKALTNVHPAKQFYEEQSIPSLKVKLSDVWGEDFDRTDPALGVSAGILELRSLFVLTEDITVAGSRTWAAIDTGTPLRDWVDASDGDDPDPTTSPFRFRIFDGTDAEIFPTDPSYPVFYPKTGIVYFADAVTRPTPFKLTAYRYIGLSAAEVVAAAGGVETVINTAVVVPVDENNVASVPVPPGALFDSPAAVTAALAGAPSFDSFTDVRNTLAGVVIDGVNWDITVASGVTRPPLTLPDDGNSCWYLNDFTLRNGGKVRIFGSPVRTAIVGPLTVLSSTPGAPGTAGSTVTFAGTPFAGLDLEGRGFETSDGAYSKIDSNTDDTLNLREVLSPAVTDGVTTGSAVRPSTIFRNSYDDVSAAVGGNPLGGVFHVDHNQDSLFEKVEIYDVQIDGFGLKSFLLGDFTTGRDSTAVLAGFRCLADYSFVNDTFSVFPNENFAFLRGGRDSGMEFYSCGTYADPTIENRPDEQIRALVVGDAGGLSSSSYVYLQGCVIAGAEDGINIQGTRLLFYFSRVERTGDSNESIFLGPRALLNAENFAFAGFGGSPNTILDTAGNGLTLSSGTATNGSLSMHFGGVAGDCLTVGDDTRVTVTAGFGDYGFKNLAGAAANGGNGINVAGIRCTLTLTPDTDVSGAGEVLVESTPFTYAFLTANSPIDTATGFTRLDNL